MWLRDFLTDRGQTVRLDGEYSNRLPVSSGVPQGSVLGPFLFVIYINDLPEIVESLSLLFADDTKISNVLNDDCPSSILQVDIDNLVKWSNEWQMKFNPQKCKVLAMGKSNPYNQYEMSTCDGSVVKLGQLNSDKDLGIIIDPALTFSQHINSQVGKANRILGIIRRSYQHIDKISFKYLFTALVRPHLEYCVTVWYPYLQKDLNAIENVLRRSTKRINGLSEIEYEERLKLVNIPSMKYRLIRGDMILTYKIINDPTNCLYSLFDLSVDNITRGHSKKLSKPFVKSSVRKRFFSNRVINNWNDLPDDVINSPSLNCFKNKLDLFWKDKMFLM